MTLRKLLSQMIQQVKMKLNGPCESIAIFPEESDIASGRVKVGNYSYFSKGIVDTQDLILENFEEKSLEILGNTMFNSMQTLKNMLEICGEDQFFCIDCDTDFENRLNEGYVDGTRVFQTASGQKTRRFSLVMDGSRFRFRHGDKKKSKDFVLGNLKDVP